MRRDWVERYLACLGLRAEPPGRDALVRLTEAHLSAVPFENASAILRRHAHPDGPVPALDPDDVLAGWEQARAGAICFVAAEMAGRLLVSLGYRAHLVLGFISFPGSHQAVVVDLDDRRWLVDVGNGTPFFEPIPLDRTVEVRRAGLAYRFRSDETPHGWLQERWIDDAWTPFCRYDLSEADPSDVEAAYQRHHTIGESWVVDDLKLIRCEPDRLSMFRAGELTTFTPSGKHTEHARPTPTIAARFGMPNLPLADAAAAVAARTPASA